MKFKKIILFSSKKIADDFISNQTNLNDKNIIINSYNIMNIKLSDSSNYIKYIKNISNYEYIIFCSRNSVEFFFKIYNKYHKANNIFPRIISIGKKTSYEINKYNKIAFQTSIISSINGLIQTIKTLKIKDSSFLIPHCSRSLSSNLISFINQESKAYHFILYEKSKIILSNNIKKRIYKNINDSQNILIITSLFQAKYLVELFNFYDIKCKVITASISIYKLFKNRTKQNIDLIKQPYVQYYISYINNINI